MFNDGCLHRFVTSLFIVGNLGLAGTALGAAFALPARRGAMARWCGAALLWAAYGFLILNDSLELAGASSWRFLGTLGGANAGWLTRTCLAMSLDALEAFGGGLLGWPLLQNGGEGRPLGAVLWATALWALFDLAYNVLGQAGIDRFSEGVFACLAVAQCATAARWFWRRPAAGGRELGQPRFAPGPATATTGQP